MRPVAYRVRNRSHLATSARRDASEQRSVIEAECTRFNPEDIPENP